MKVKLVKIGLIKPYHRNPRKNDKAVPAVKKSISDYGFNVPITVDADNVIVTGHTRYRAARELGMEKLPVVVLDLPKAKITEYRIADNKAGEMSEWDYDMLIPELREIIDIDDFQTYFNDQDLKHIIDAEYDDTAFKDVTTKIIETRQNVLDAKYDGVNQSQEDDIVEIPCSHCGKSSFISASDVMSKLKK